MKNIKNIIFGLLLLIGNFSHAQEKKASDSVYVKSIDGIVNAAYEIISGKEGKVRNWEKLRNLYLPNAKFTILYHPADSIPLSYETVSLDELVELMHDEYYEKGFTQYELGKVINRYNGIANVFQSFYAKDSENQEAKGITSYQLIYFNGRWWVSDVLWTTDSNGKTIPEKYLKD